MPYVRHASEVDELVEAAIAAGRSTYNPPQDHGFMYQHGFHDLDGHIWELVYMSGEPVEPAEPRSA
jgi:predicted lactoylglutathione lyase